MFVDTVEDGGKGGHAGSGFLSTGPVSYNKPAAKETALPVYQSDHLPADRRRATACQAAALAASASTGPVRTAGGAKMVIAPGWTRNFAGVEVTISPSVLTGIGFLVSISNSRPRAVRTSSHAPCVPARN